MKRTDSITFRTVLLITVPLTVLLLIAGSVINWQIKFLYDEIVNQNIAIAQARGAQVGAVMNEVTDFSKSLRAIARLRNGTIPEKLQAMGNVVKWRPANIDDLMFIAPNGDFTNSNGSTGSVAKRAYFQEMITSGNDYQLNPPVMSVLDGTPLFTVIVRLNNDNGDLEGFISCAIKLETLGRVCKSIAFGKTGYGWIVDDKGLVLSHPNKDMIFKLDLKTADAEMGFKGLAELNEKMQALPLASAGSYGYYTKPDGKRIITLFTKIPNSPDWLLGMSIETEEFFAKQEEMLLMLLGLFGACIVLVVALSIFIARDIAKPIRQAQRAFETLASGNADLTAKIKFTGKNEIGQLVSSFNKFLDKLRDMVVNLKDEQKKLDQISRELKTNTENTAETTIRMSDTIQKVMGRTVRQNDLTNDSSAGVNEIAANIESLDNLIASQASSIIEASSSIEQMVHNISSISTSMNKMSEEFSHVSSASAAGKDKILAMNETILKIVSRSEVLLDVNKTIAEIASMTNLLAMNAAIESAHAGESGKGFAVVADEIRRLAENSSTQSTIINKELTEVQKAISEVSTASLDSQQVFTEMSSRIGSTDGLLKEIHRALQEQSEGSREILVALKEMNEISSEVRSGASEMRSGNTTILSAMNGLKTVTDEIGEMMHKLTESSGDIAMKANGLSRMAEGTSDAVTSMEGSIGQFTV